MQFVDIEKKDGGAYLHRYDLHYIDRTGCPRTYEMVSRDRNIDSLAHLQQHRTDAVVMVLTDAKRERMALNHEYQQNKPPRPPPRRKDPDRFGNGSAPIGTIAGSFHPKHIVSRW